MNLCLDCRVMDKLPCPILRIAYEKGLDGMSKCEMYQAVEEIVKEIKEDRRK